MSTSTSWEQVRDESLAAMSETERAEHDAASIEAEARLQIAELVYNARPRRPLPDRTSPAGRYGSVCHLRYRERSPGPRRHHTKT